MNVFESLVAEMRKQQRKQHIKQTPEGINKVRALEHQVDKMIDAMRSAPRSEDLGFEWPFDFRPDLINQNVNT